MAQPEELRPAWSLPAGTEHEIALPVEWPPEVTREWAWGESTGKGVTVCILDSGVEAGHPLVGEVQRSVAVSIGENDEVLVQDDTESDPWRFSSVISVGSHEDADSQTFFYNPDPPVEFFARGVNVEVAWAGGARIRCTGNSFATPHISGLCALVLGKHPQLTPFQLK